MISRKGFGMFLLAGGLLVSGCGKPQTKWRVAWESPGICGMGIKTERQARRAALDGCANTLTSILNEECLWSDYVNADKTLPTLTLEERRITPDEIDDSGTVMLTLRFVSPAPIDEPAARLRVEHAVKQLLKDRWHQEGQRALADLRARRAALTDKTDEASAELARQLDLRLAEVETQIDEHKSKDVIRLTISES